MAACLYIAVYIPTTASACRRYIHDEPVAITFVSVPKTMDCAQVNRNGRLNINYNI